MSVITDYLTKTTKVLHVYADGTSGDDANTGKSGSPVKTITKALSLIPDVISHNTVLHLSGSFDLVTEIPGSSATWGKEVNAGCNFVIDGGDDTQLAAVGSENFAITSSTTSSVTSTGAGWTVDEWKGFWVKTSTGQIRQIHSNTADTILPCANFSPAPTGAFDVVKPATAFESGSTRSVYFSCTGSGNVYLQRINTGINVRIAMSTIVYSFYMSALIIEDTSEFSNFNTMLVSYGGFSAYSRDPANLPSAFSNILASVTNRGTSSFRGKGSVTISSYVGDTLEVTAGELSTVYGGINVKKLVFDKACFSSPLAFGYSSSYRPVVVSGSSDVGFSMIDTQGTLKIASNKLEIKNCASHGIEVNNSQIQFEGGISGTGNAGAGVYAHNGATVTTKAGTAPTLTGTAGDLAVTNPASADATWAQINGGDTLVSAAERTLVKAQ